MADVRPIDVVNMFNSRVRNRANSGIAWGSNSKPANGGHASVQTVYDNYFKGHTNGLSNAPAASSFTGSVKFSTINNQVLSHAAKYTAIRNTWVKIRFKYNNPVSYGGGNSRGGYSSGGSRVGTTQYDTIVNSAKIAHLGTAHDVASIPDPSSGIANLGTGALTKSVLAEYMDAVWNNVKAVRNSTVNIHRDVCHNSCHNSCHDSCHGDGPGGSPGGG